ncbi:hypothetical protein D3C78_967370 [compost metagenome]
MDSWRKRPAAVGEHVGGADWVVTAVDVNQRTWLADTGDCWRIVVGEPALRDRPGHVSHVVFHGNDRRRLRGRNVRGGGVRRRPCVSGFIGGLGGEDFAVKFWRGDGHAEVALIVRFAFANFYAIFADGHSAARFCGPGDFGSITRNDRVIGG